MKRHHARLVAVAVLVVVLCAGAAFVRLNAKQQIAERREAATRNISTHAAAIDRELDAALRHLRSTATAVPDRGVAYDFASAAADVLARVPIGEHVILIRAPATITLFPARSDSFPQELLRAWAPRTDASESDMAIKSIRYQGAEYGIIGVSAPKSALSKASRTASWVAASIPIDRLLRAAAFERLQNAGYDYQLIDTETSGRSHRILARSRESTLSDPVEQIVSRSDGQWRIAMAPRGGWILGLLKWRATALCPGRAPG